MMNKFAGRALAFAFTFVYVSAVTLAADWDQAVVNGLNRLIVADLDGDQVADLTVQSQLPNTTNFAVVSTSAEPVVQRWHDGHLLLNWSGETTKWHVGDFNGDARSDLLLQGISEKSPSHLVLTKVDDTVGVVAQSIPYLHLGAVWDATESEMTVGDFDGDWRDDIFLQSKQRHRRHFLIGASADGSLNRVQFEFDDEHLGLDWSTVGHKLIAGEFDGDGRKDLFLQASSMQSDSGIVLSKTHPLSTLSQVLENGFMGLRLDASSAKIVSGDFEGDDVDELLVWQKRGNREALILKIVEGRLSGIAAKFDLQAESEDIREILVGDFNGDGRDEAVVFYRGHSELAVLHLGDTQAQSEIHRRLLQLGLINNAQQVKWLPAVLTSTTTTAITAATPMALAAPICDDLALANVDDVSVNPCPDPEPDPDPQPTPTPYIKQALQPISAVAKTEGVASVSGGASSYSVEMVLPPGRLGMKPSVSLNYSSRGGNGVAGMGWSLSATSMIHRCDPIADLDGYNGAISFQTGANGVGTVDPLCLDGNRLKLISGSNGAAGSSYRTEIDTLQLVKLVSGDVQNNSAKFEITDADGHVSTYGMMNGGTGSIEVAKGHTKPRAWYLAQKRDLNGNSIDFKYQLAGAGEVLLEAIYYTGTYTNGATVFGNRVVRFFYETRSDVTTAYMAGGFLQKTKRLAAIHSYVNSELIRQLTLYYVQSLDTDRSLLDQIQECAIENGNKYCAVPSRFEWQSTDANWATPSAPIGEETGDVVRFSQSIDWDGDGIVEMHGRSKVGSQFKDEIFFMSSNWSVRKRCDVTDFYNYSDAAGNQFSKFRGVFDSDDDGKMEYLSWDDSLKIYKATKYDLGSDGCPIAASTSTYSIPVDDRYLLNFIDVNGDGFQDLVATGRGTNDDHGVWYFPSVSMSGGGKRTFGTKTLMYTRLKNSSNYSACRSEGIS